MFEKEARGLELLRKNCSLIIPQVIRQGNADDKQYLLLDWLEKGAPQKDMWERFGQALALMHKRPQHYYGLDEDNYIGSLLQTNKKQEDWSSFYAECRIMPLVKKLFDEGNYTSKDLVTAENFCRELKNIFPTGPASLLHGDLWAGNYLVHSSGQAAIYDPAVYFGHREMDIGMTKLFGGFERTFYSAYHEAFPLARGWEERSRITQLYPLLVHAVLFGGHYVSTTREIMVGFS